MKTEQITLRCEDGAEAVVFSKYTYEKTIIRLPDISTEFENSYEINVEDSYIGGDYKGFFGRIKRAWRAFWDKPVVYTGIYCEDETKMKHFLCSCLDLLNGVESDKPVSNEELIKKGEW